MSVSMFFVLPKTDEERFFNIPICTEDAFEDVLLPAAEKIGASYVQRFGIGCEISAADTVQIAEEIVAVAIQIEKSCPDMCSYLLPRLKRLQQEIERILGRSPEAVLYIG